MVLTEPQVETPGGSPASESGCHRISDTSTLRVDPEPPVITTVTCIGSPCKGAQQIDMDPLCIISADIGKPGPHTYRLADTTHAANVDAYYHSPDGQAAAY